ncbi:uncharacterized protein LOC103513256 [Diaphorina citri]|uniref:Uncharacterized protein LOC103513256 n=1 Tax=Diaphorina citri TaxID=121845 RepID=A0A1S3D7W6_DIACI|nr:uncharacterized protein LOC103513256 [Diaphorina citri]
MLLGIRTYRYGIIYFKIPDNKLSTQDLHARYEGLIKEDEDKIIPGLGENGRAGTLPGLTNDIITKIMKIEAFNKVLSDHISYTRKIPDARFPECHELKYDEDLPTIGGFSWSGHYTWIPIPDFDTRIMNNPTDPVP